METLRDGAAERNRRTGAGGEYTVGKQLAPYGVLARRLGREMPGPSSRIFSTVFFVQ